MATGARIWLAAAILLAAIVPTFWIYLQATTPPAAWYDLLVHVFFFPLIFPLVPVFLDGAFDLGVTAYAVYPGIALALAMLAGTRHPLRLAALAMGTAFLLPWIASPQTVMGFQMLVPLAGVLGSDVLGHLAIAAIPLGIVLTTVLADHDAGPRLAVLTGSLMLAALLVAGSGAGFLDALGGLAVGGWAGLAASVATIAIGAARLRQTGA